MSEHKHRDERMTLLEDRLATLEQIFDTNTAVFSDSLQLTELCIQALQRSFDDMLIGTIKLIDVNGTKRVDFKAYLKDAMELRLASSKVELDTPVARESDTVVFDFGG